MTNETLPNKWIRILVAGIVVALQIRLFAGAISSNIGYVFLSRGMISIQTNYSQLLGSPSSTEQRIPFDSNLIFDHAMAWFSQAKQLDSGQASRGIAVIHILRGSPEHAVKVLSSVQKDSLWRCVDLGIAWGQQHESKQAVGQWQNCPQIAYFFLQIGYKDNSAGNISSAEIAFRQAIAIDAGLLEANYALGDLYRAAERWNDAMNVYRTISQLNQKGESQKIDMWTLLTIGHLFREKGSGCDEALYWYELARFEYPHNEFPYIYQGACYTDTLRKIESFRTAIAINPGNFRGYYWLGLAYRQQGALQDAVNYLEQAIRLAPDDINSLLTLAATCQDLRQYDRALGLYERILQVNPEHPRALQEIQRLRAIMEIRD